MTFYHRFLLPNIKYFTWVQHLPNAVCCLVLISSTLSWYPYLHSSSFGASIPVPLLQNPHLNQNQLCNLQEQIWRLLGMIHLLLQSWPSTMEAMHRNQSMLQSRVRTALLFSLEISRYWTHFLQGDIFDVTHKADSYGPGKSYNVFAGKDGSRGLGKSSLKVEDAVADYSTLGAPEKKVLDDWHSFFSCVYFSIWYPFFLPSLFFFSFFLRKRYNIVGKVSDGPNIES